MVFATGSRLLTIFEPIEASHGEKRGMELDTISSCSHFTPGVAKQHSHLVTLSSPIQWPRQPPKLPTGFQNMDRACLEAGRRPR